MASNVERKSTASFLTVVAAVYLSAALLATVALVTEVLHNGAEVWSIGVLAIAVTATVIWGFMTRTFFKGYQRASRKVMA